MTYLEPAQLVPPPVFALAVVAPEGARLELGAGHVALGEGLVLGCGGRCSDAGSAEERSGEVDQQHGRYCDARVE